MPIITPKGLRGLNGISSLSEDEYNAFISDNSDLIARHNYDPKYISNLYSNKQFIDTFGRDAFRQAKANGLDLNARNELLKDKVVTSEFEKLYSPFNEDGTRDNSKGFGAEYEKYFGQIDPTTGKRVGGISTDGLLRILESDYLTPEEFEARWKKDIEESKKNAGYNEKGVNAFVPGTAFTPVQAAMTEYNMETGAGETLKKIRKSHNDRILENIYNDEADNAANRLSEQVSDVYSNSAIATLSDKEVVDAFKRAITPNPSAGNLGIPEYASHYGIVEGDVSSEMEDFSIDEMRQVLAKKAVYDQYLSPDMAMTALNNEAKKYIHARQGFGKRAALFAKDVAIASASYTADKVNGFYNIGLMAADAFSGEKPVVWVDVNDNVVDTNKNKLFQNNVGDVYYYDENGNRVAAHQEQIDRTTLHNMGKNMDGTENTSWLNPQDWTRREQFGVWDKDLAKQYEKLGSSPYKVVYEPNDDRDLLYESFKMMSFGLADAGAQLIPFGIGAAGKALSTANNVGKVVQGIGRAAHTASKFLVAGEGVPGKIGATVQGLSGAVGIAEAYQRGAFQETLAQNMANLEQKATEKGRNDIYNQYNNDVEYKKDIDALIDARAKTMKAEYIASLGENGKSQIFDEEKLDEVIKSRAREAVLSEAVQNKINEYKNSDEYAALQEEGINSAGWAATNTFWPEAIKYGLVNTIGFRKYLYTTPTSVTQKAINNFKGLREITTSAGKKRLATDIGKTLTNKEKWKNFGKVAGGQIWGGAWTNGTDDMMVDAAERINEDSYSRYLHDYETGESTADTYGFADGMFSYWKGLHNSLGQETTAEAAIVGGLGSTISGNLHFTNIASLATKEGREAYRKNFQQRYERDDDGMLKFDEESNPIVKEVGWKENWRDRLGFFIQNGVLNTYYGKKQEMRNLQEHADFVNSILDDMDDFKDIESLISSDIGRENALNIGDEKTMRFVHAFNAVHALENLGKDEKDPSTLSSVVMQHKDLVERASKIGTNEDNMSDEEKANLISQYYSNNPGLAQTEENNQIALQNIAQNARKLQEAYTAYNKAEENIQALEKEKGAPIVAPVRFKMKMSQALDEHWKERLETMKNEIGDVSSSEPTSGEELVAAVGGRKAAESLLKNYGLQENFLLQGVAQAVSEQQRMLDIYNDAQSKLREAEDRGDSAAVLQAQTALKEARDNYEEAVEDRMGREDTLSASIEKKDRLQEAYDALEKGVRIKTLKADEIMSLDPVTRAMMLADLNKGEADPYSPAQRKQIEKLKAQLKNFDKTGDPLQKIQDIALLTRRIAQNEDAYHRLSRNPDAAAVQLEKQQKIAAENAYNLINRRNAETLADYINEMEDALRGRKDVSKKAKEEYVYRTLRNKNTNLLDIIEQEDLLPNYILQVQKAKEWAKVTSDIDAVINSSEEDSMWKDNISKNIENIVERADSKTDIIKSLEQVIDDVNDPDVAADFDKILTGLDKLGYTRDATVVESRKQRKAREEAARKKLEEDKARAEAEAKAAAEKAAQEAAKKAEETKTATSTPEAIDPLNDIDLGEGVETSSKEQDTKKVTKPSYHRSMKEQIGDKKSTWKYYTDDERNTDDRTNNIIGPAFQATLVPAINYAVDARVIGEEYRIPNDARPSAEVSEKIRQATKDLYRLKIRTPQQLIEYVEQHEGKGVGPQTESTKSTFKAADVQRKQEAKVMSDGVLVPSKEGDAKTYTFGSQDGRKVFYPSASVTQLRVSAQQDSFFEKGHSTAAVKDAGGYVVYEPGEYKEERGALIVTKKAKIGFYKNSPEELNNIEIQQNEESSVTDNIEQSEEEALRNEWFNNGETSEVELTEEGNNYVAETPSLEEEVQNVPSEEADVKEVEQREDPETANEQGTTFIETKEDVLSGNAMEEYVTDSLKKFTLKRKKGTRGENDSMNKYFAWMDAEGIKLQDIVDDELHQIIEAYEEEDAPLKVKFMAIKRENNSTHDKDMKNHLMLVVDYNNVVSGIHQEDRGGVISTGNKKYLIIGVVGYGKDIAENAGRKKLRDILFNGVNGKGDGLAIKGMGEFFRNHPEERFFVNDNISTEIVPNSLIPGYVVKQTKEDSSSFDRTISELLEDNSRNPHNLKMEDLGWYIQERTTSVAVNTHGREVMQPSDAEANVGRAFVLIPASNGKLIPAFIKPVTFPEMASSEKFGNSELVREITNSLNVLIAPPSKENLPVKKQALKSLSQTLYLDKDHNFILMSKDGSVISLVREGEDRAPFATYNLKSPDFNPEAFIRDFYRMNPHINITPTVLRDANLLKKYNDAGALQTDLARLYTAGASYSIYPLDAQGKIMRTENAPNTVTWNRGNSEFRNENRALVYYGGHPYYYDATSNTFHENQSSPAIQDADLLEQLKYNMQVMNLVPEEDNAGKKVYILKEGEHPEIVQEDKNSHRITKMSEEAAKNYLAEKERKKAAKERAEAAEKAIEEQVAGKQAIDLGIDYVDEETGELIIAPQEAQPEKKEEIEVEEEPSAEKQRSREDYADKSVESSAEYKATSSTQTFKQLSKNKKHKSAVFEAISKMPDSPVKFNEKGKLAPVTTEAIEDYLKSMKIPIDAIGTSDADIQAWLHTLECR